MANFTISIPDDKVARVVNAFALQFGWNAELGVTKAQFAKQKLIEHVRNVVKAAEAPVAGQTAADAKVAEIESDLSTIS